MISFRSIRCTSLVIAIATTSSCGEGTTTPIPVASAVGQLAVGEQSVCALGDGEVLYCWGLNSSFFEFGMDPATRPTSDGPVRVSAPPLASLSAGVSQHWCGQSTTSGTFYCWGRGGNGQLGAGVADAAGNPFTLVSGSVWSNISVSRLTSCGVTTLGTGMCWGINQRGEIGSATVAIGQSSPTPIPVDGTFKFKSIAAGWLHACGITTDGSAMCWGDNRHGQLGLGTIDTAGTPPGAHASPAPVVTNEKFLMLASGATQTCGITTNNRVMCWGDNEMGQLGDGTTTDHGVPTAIKSDLKFQMVSLSSGFRGTGIGVPPATVSQGGSGHACALTVDGIAYCWGWNGDGQLGDNTTTDRLTPAAVSAPIPFSTIGAGGAFTCAMRGHQVWCWGANSTGQLGIGHGIGSFAATPRVVAAPFDQP